MICSGKTPISMQLIASKIIGINIISGASPTQSHFATVYPENALKNTLRNDARVSAETDIAINVMTGLNIALEVYISHLDANPLNGGIPLIDAAPTIKHIVVIGRLFASPPNSLRFVV